MHALAWGDVIIKFYIPRTHSNTVRVTVKLLRPYSDTAGWETRQVEFGGGTLRALLLALGERFPALGKELLGAGGAPDEAVALLLNGRMAGPGDGAALGEGDTVTIFTPVSGG